MGLTASSGLHRGVDGHGPGGVGGQETSGSHIDVIRRCNCYSLSLDRKCYRHSLTFHPSQSTSQSHGDSLDSAGGGEVSNKGYDSGGAGGGGGHSKGRIFFSIFTS